MSYAVGDAAAESVRRDLTAIRDDLRCTTVMLIASDTVRQLAAAEQALELGLAVYLRPYLEDRPAAEVLDHLARTAGNAERLRIAHPGRVTLLLGSEFSLTSQGMLPGHRIFFRLQVLVRPRLRRMFDRRVTTRLRRFLAEALVVARANFDGPVTYAAGHWEDVDWSSFDLVGVNLYRFGTDTAGYERRLRELVGQPKPVVVTEFGCGAFVGADRLGPGSFRIVNWFADPPRIRGGHTRSEATQSAYLSELIELYAAHGVHGCFVYTFVSPGFPHHADAARDLDMAGFGLVKSRCDDDPSRWEPKLAFHEVARRYAELER